MQESQAINFVNKTKNDFLSVLALVQQAQAVALQNSQRTTASGGGQAIVDAVPQATWDASFPDFTKAEFVDILGNMSMAADLLGNHGDLKTNLYKLID